ncbi:precorrin-2 dehydrogenase/sirohydrochlorin ferrochelatase family protein [Novosphingobium album (ex Liu et al. 2023)]|uniref:precorrin-2 dehydrogenase n=1 Tax=Novosphingobium album (ex Liu et al. 2023) TaxID=3031130 RepID=A0ABT5WSZ5_9SPHN|nr:NAD(P)-dependent oxidoreductase [Novosphingobium album (ex Liu et al. 2023)]MDE8652964.1 NAD(P)-dependent oxidoreductase [Novosphingobium album (ex Liu et al. 2023)]
MIAHLPLFHRIAGQPVIVLGTGDIAEARRRLVERAGGEVIGDAAQGIDRGARLAFVAHADEADARADTLRLRHAGILVNTADRPELCDFIVPAILDRAPVLLAIGTGGASAGLAKALRLRLEALLPSSLGRLAEVLAGARAALRARWPDAGDRRRALDAALGQGGALDPLDPASAGRLDGWLAGGPDGTRDAMVEIVLASTDPEDLTLRQARLLGSADCIAHEPRVPAAILDRARADAARVPIAPGETPPLRAGLVIVLRS